MQTLILASASPRREQLMGYLGFPFVVMPSPIDEGALELSGPPAQRAMDAAVAKAMAVAVRETGHWVLGADTVVCVDGLLLGKPKDEADAYRMLSLLSGRDHVVTTGVCLCRDGMQARAPIYEETRVWIKVLTQAQIMAYIATGEPMDKAGAYGIQGFGGAMIPRIEGDYFNVMGLPLYRTVCLLEEAGIVADDTKGKEGAHA